MLPPATASHLIALRHVAKSVADVGLEQTDDDIIYETAVDLESVLVTENFSHFAMIDQRRAAGGEPRVALAFVRKRTLPPGGAMATALAHQLDSWATENPDPYPGLYWP